MSRRVAILRRWAVGALPSAMARALLLPRRLRRLLPATVQLPEGYTVWIDEPATVTINLYEEYVVDQYGQRPGFIPSPGDVVFDVGAYVGVYALRCAARVGPTGRVYAFEPHPALYARLTRNVARNAVGHVHCLAEALGDAAGTRTLYSGDAMHVVSSTLCEAYLRRFTDRITTTQVALRTLDGVLDTLAVDVIDLLKVDVEGAEARVLQGAQDALAAGRVARLIVEVHEDAGPLDRVLNRLPAAYTYECVRCHPDPRKVLVYAQRRPVPG